MVNALKEKSKDIPTKTTRVESSAAIFPAAPPTTYPDLFAQKIKTPGPRVASMAPKSYRKSSEAGSVRNVVGALGLVLSVISYC